MSSKKERASAAGETAKIGNGFKEVNEALLTAVETAERLRDSMMRRERIEFEAWAIRERGFSEIVKRDEAGEYVRKWVFAKWLEWQTKP